MFAKGVERQWIRKAAQQQKHHLFQPGEQDILEGKVEMTDAWLVITCWTDFQGEYWRLLLPARRPFLVQVLKDETNLYKLKHVMTTIFNETCHDHGL